MNDPREMIKAFSCFEREKAITITRFRACGFLVWPIIKSSLCYNYLKKQAIPPSVNPSRSALKKAVQQGENLLKLFFKLLPVFVKRQFRKAPVLFYAKSAD